MGEKCTYEVALDNYNAWRKAWYMGRKEKHIQDQETLEQIEIGRARIIEMIQDGILLFDEDEESLEYIFLLPKDDSSTLLTLKRPKGDLALSGDKYDENQLGHRMAAMLAVMSKKPSKFFSLIDFVDLENLQVIGGHFLLT